VPHILSFFVLTHSALFDLDEVTADVKKIKQMRALHSVSIVSLFLEAVALEMLKEPQLLLLSLLVALFLPAVRLVKQPNFYS
jgi:hypothetical protein